MPWPAVAAGIASVAGAGASLASIGASAYGMATSEKAARQMWESQREVNATNIAITDKQMAFQERMSSTAHQRQIQDMKAAGLNPILSAGSGASSPGGSAVQIQSPGSRFSGIGASARDTGRLVNEGASAIYNRDMMRSSAAKAKADTLLTQMEVKFAKRDPNAYFLSKHGTLDYGTAKGGARILDLLHALQSRSGKKAFKRGGKSGAGTGALKWLFD